jgi:hypothetical protein
MTILFAQAMRLKKKVGISCALSYLLRNKFPKSAQDEFPEQGGAFLLMRLS